MKLKLITTILLIFPFLIGYGQNEMDKIKLFEKKITQFRFSLNKELEKMDDEKISKLDFNQKDSIVIKANEFCEKNQQEIIDYRLALLKQYEDNKFDVALEEYDKISWDRFQSAVDYLKENHEPGMTNLLFINSLDEIDFYETLYFSSEKSIRELAMRNVKRTITAPIITTKKGNTQWEVYVNHYDQITKSTFDAHTGEIIDFVIYERKKQ